MAKQKYDWIALKLEFFQSDIDEVESYLSQKWIKRNWWGIAKQTKGRAKEKQAYKEKILQQALERRAKEEAKNLEIPMDQLKKAKKTVLWLLMKKLQQVIDWGDINVKEQEKILKMIKTELWEPTSISKNDNTVRGVALDESLFIQD